MKTWKARLMALLVAGAMLVAIQGPVMAQDCDFVGFDEFGDAIFVCDTDFDEDDFFFDEDFDDDDFFFDDNGFFFFDDDLDDEDCIGPIAGNECIGVG